jgi:hypothetical protein
MHRREEKRTIGVHPLLRDERATGSLITMTSDDAARSSEMGLVVIGHDGESIELLVRGYRYPDADNAFDRSQLDCLLNIRIGGLSATLTPDIRVDELARFRSELEVIHTDLDGAATFAPMSPAIEMTITVNPAGQLRVDGIASDGATFENKLTFAIGGLDQTDLPPLIDEIRSIEQAPRP